MSNVHSDFFDALNIRKEQLEQLKSEHIAILNARKERFSAGRVAFNIVAGVAKDSDDFEFLNPDLQARWEQAVHAAEEHRKNNCTICGEPWVKHEFGVPAPECP